jgi:PAS domain S-box-containing protein
VVRAETDAPDREDADSRRAEAALRDAERRLYAVLDNASAAIFFMNERQHCTYMNAAAEALTGFTLAEVEGRPLHDVIHHTRPDGRPFPIGECPIDRAFPEGKRVQGEEVFVRKDGSFYPVAFTASPLRDERSRAIGTIIEVRDTSAERETRDALTRLNETLEQEVAARTADLLQAQEALRHSQKMDALGQLTGGLAHDFNNLLTIIRSAADLLRLHDLAQERRRRYVDAIADTADRASRLTSQLLAFARRQPLEPVVFDAGARVDQIAEMIRTLVGSRFEVDVRTEDSDCFVEADPAQFETALLNMAANARDAMGRDGRIVIHVRCTNRLPTIRGHAGHDAAFVAISIEDSGSGIGREHLGQIFEPFFTTKALGKGTGLGLSQVYGFAKQSGGDVDVDSIPGKGTTFTLYLPGRRAPAPAEEAARPQPVERLPAGSRILVVEDNLAVGQFTSQLLEEMGYSVALAANAKAALDLLAEDEKGFDVVLTDVVMPGLSGVELAQLIAARFPACRIILTSGYSNVLAEEGRHGFDLLKKPYSAEELVAMLRGSGEQASGTAAEDFR